MSRSRHYWVRIVRTIIYQYPDKLDCNTKMGDHAYKCIRSALEETETLADGDERKRLISMVFIKKTHYTYGAAIQLHISESTAKRWIAQFIRLVAKKMGYI